VDNVGFDDLEPGLALEMAQVLLSSRTEVVEAKHVRALGQKSVTQMGAEETGPSGDEDVPAFAILHRLPLFGNTHTLTRTVAGMFLNVKSVTWVQCCSRAHPGKRSTPP
jgi:hypothetical protein